MAKDEYLVRVRFYADLGEHDTSRLAETITELGNTIEMPKVPQSAKEHGVEAINFITVEVFKKIE